MHPIRDRWWASDPANFFLAFGLLAIFIVAGILAIGALSPWLLVLVACAMFLGAALWRKRR